MNTISRLCSQMALNEASDLFLSVGRKPYARIGGELKEDALTPAITLAQVQEFIESAFPLGTWNQLQENKDLDMSMNLPGEGRFRVNLSFQRSEVSLAIRRVPSGAIDSKKLLIPDEVIAMADEARGLILVTGATGSGKSTTLAALLHHINLTAHKHIVTIEDPIEFYHEDIESLISQREIGGDTHDFHSALKSVVRQNPDAIFIGEIRDQQTLQTAISAALTGHLVAATMHTIDVPQTLERILNYFPEDYREQIARDLAQTLIGIVSQRLIPRKDSNARIAAFEFLRTSDRHT